MEKSTLLPAIVVVAFRREKPLSRLLKSIAEAVFPIDRSIPLILCLEGDADEKVATLAQNFQWSFGEKKIIRQTRRLGLKEHILRCGDLTNEYGSIILLEDDLFVAPGFYQFAQAALTFYENDPQIGGVSLYRYQIAENGFYPFEPIDDDQDVYFQQFASSWGQAWTAAQWQRFRNWLAQNAEQPSSRALPEYLNHWSAQSWKKVFVRYLIEQNRYFVFPRQSFSTNTGQAGEHAPQNDLFLTPLSLAVQSFRFIALENSRSVYDAFFEPEPRTVNAWTNRFLGKNFEVDLFGTKKIVDFDAEFWLSSKNVLRPLPTEAEGFDLCLSPEILNVIKGLKGNVFHFAPRQYFSPRKTTQPAHFARNSKQMLALPQNEPSFRFCVAVLAADNFTDLIKTLNSLLQTNQPFLECKAFVSAGQTLPDLSAFSHFVQILEIDADVNVNARLLAAFSQLSGEINAILFSGQTVEPQAFRHLTGIFGQNPQIKWLTSPPDDKFSLQQSRWSLKKFADKPQTFPNFTLWFSQTLLERLALQTLKDEISLQAKWEIGFDISPLYTFAQPLVLGTRLETEIFHSSQKAPISARLFEPFFLKDAPFLRVFYRDFMLLPDVVRYDAATDSYYLSAY